MCCESKKTFKCDPCGRVIEVLIDSAVPAVSCCGQAMVEMVVKKQDVGNEKHLPVIEKLEQGGVKVVVGSVAHPMTDEHYIPFVYVQSEKGGQRKGGKPGELPIFKFSFVDDKPLCVYAYCNLHGLWKTDV